MPVTDDERYVVIDGRRWRATDPSIPGRLRQELVDELMDARRAVGAAKRSDDGAAERLARRRVNDAKVALGERGEPWWAATAEGRDVRVASTIRALLHHRDASASICPSDVARAVGGGEWRSMLSHVRERAASMSDDGTILVTQRDEVVDATKATGPIRLRRGPRFDDRNDST